MQTFFQNFMTQGDYETFYPYLMGVGKSAPNNFESSFFINDEKKDTNKKNYIVVSVILAVLLIAGIFIYKANKK